MRILCLGDIAGPAACNAACKSIWKIRKKYDIQFTVVNAENCALGNGIDKDSAQRLFICGADVITTGNHIWKKKDIRNFLDDCNDIIRPDNYINFENGYGYVVKEQCEKRILVMNAVGTVYMGDGIGSPFESIDRMLAVNKDAYDISILDFHAEATSEKYAIARHYDGIIDIIFGTHTHVPTADARILPKSTGYITDLGMCGSDSSILGIKSDIIISRYLGKEGEKFVFEDKDIVLNGAIFDTGSRKFGVTKVERVKFNPNEI